MDPRLYQIATLATLLVYGMARLEFDVSPPRVAFLVTVALLTQWICTRWTGAGRFDPRSALISSLSLGLLLRTESWLFAAAAAVIAVGSKFAVRIRGKHVFNPTNIAIVVLILLTDAVWVSPGQWGSTAIFAFAIAGAGFLVVQRAARADVTVAFLAFMAAIQFGRAAWLGQPWAVPLHRMENGALLLFAFFMISDPKTTPDSRLGRIVFAGLVALGASFVSFGLYRTNGLLWSLAACSLVVPLLDRLLPGERYSWNGVRPPRARSRKDSVMLLPRIRRFGAAALHPHTRLAIGGFGLVMPLLTLAPHPAAAFCGFYVARADAKLFNEASQVVLVRDADRTVMTMVNDYKGDLQEFAVVVPVPTVLERGQIHAGDPAHVEHLDAYTAPRLVEYFDPDPCAMKLMAERALPMAMAKSSDAAASRPRGQASGVVIEARYAVGEYDILILSARQSDGLETWLRDNGYRVPTGASRALEAYVKQGMKFFVARVNLQRQSELGFAKLRPLQIAYENAKFMLPIRLGMVNASGPQDLLIYALTRNGRVETTNYRTVRLPSDVEIPPYVKSEFTAFYRAMFAEQVRRADMRAVFLEYAWDMGWCDPCAADPLSAEELRALGVFWLDGASPGRGGAANVFVTRLHVRYDRAHFPEDLAFQVTGDRENFQGRYILRHPWTGNGDCESARAYRDELRQRQERESQALAELTGWKVAEIRERVGLNATPAASDRWWSKLWGG